MCSFVLGCQEGALWCCFESAFSNFYTCSRNVLHRRRKECLLGSCQLWDAVWDILVYWFLWCFSRVVSLRANSWTLLLCSCSADDIIFRRVVVCRRVICCYGAWGLECCVWFLFCCFWCFPSTIDTWIWRWAGVGIQFYSLYLLTMILGTIFCWV